MAPRLLACAVRDALPVLETAADPLRIDLHDRIFRDDRRNRAHAELGGFLYDEIHRIRLSHSLKQCQVELGLWEWRARGRDPQLGTIASVRPDFCQAFVAFSVKDDNVVAGPEPEHVTQVVRLPARKRNF
jgi:hypothetical protein